MNIPRRMNRPRRMDAQPESMFPHTVTIYNVITRENPSEGFKPEREMYDKPKNFNVRELLTPQQIRKVMRYESIIQGLLNFGQDYHGVKAILDNPAAFLPKKTS